MLGEQLAVCTNEHWQYFDLDQRGAAAAGPHVRFGSEADIRTAISHVRFTPNSGHVQRTSRCPLSANSGHVQRTGACPLSANSGHRTLALK